MKSLVAASFLLGLVAFARDCTATQALRGDGFTKLTAPLQVQETQRLLRAMSAPPAASCPIETGVDYPGNDIGNTPAAKADDCCLKCWGVAGCKAYTWTNYNGGTCWFKSGKGQTVSNPNAKSAVVWTWQYCSPQQTGIDYPGNDIGSGASATADGCCDVCRFTNGCRAYSWTNQNGGTCWLKSGRSAAQVNSNVISAVIDQSLPPVCTIEAGLDYVGNDIGNKPSKDVFGCCDICKGFSGCKAYSWSNNNGGTCWIKSAKGSTVANSQVTSGVIPWQ